MLKKILLISLLFLSFFNIGFADLATHCKNNPSSDLCEKDDDEKKPTTGSDNLMSTGFTIDTSMFSPGGDDAKLKQGNAKDTINKTLGTFIQKAMIFLGILSLLIMIIGAGYMILHHGEDEYLTKGKNIFVGGIIALIVASTSYYLVTAVGYILYSK